MMAGASTQQHYDRLVITAQLVGAASVLLASAFWFLSWLGAVEDYISRQFWPLFVAVILVGAAIIDNSLFLPTSRNPTPLRRSALRSLSHFLGLFACGGSLFCLALAVFWYSEKGLYWPLVLAIPGGTSLTLYFVWIGEEDGKKKPVSVVASPARRDEERPDPSAIIKGGAFQSLITIAIVALQITLMIAAYFVFYLLRAVIYEDAFASPRRLATALGPMLEILAILVASLSFVLVPIIAIPALVRAYRQYRLKRQSPAAMRELMEQELHFIDASFESVTAVNSKNASGALSFLVMVWVIASGVGLA